jgi:hypothetical protein
MPAYLGLAMNLQPRHREERSDVAISDCLELRAGNSRLDWNLIVEAAGDRNKPALLPMNLPASSWEKTGKQKFWGKALHEPRT